MIYKCFTLGVYEDRRVYFRFLAEAIREIIRNGILTEANIVWYRLNQKLYEWTQDVKRRQTNLNPNPFGEKPYLIHLNRANDELPGETERLDWDGQKDIPQHLITSVPTPGRFCLVKNIDLCPLPNIIVVDHELFRKDMAEAVSSEGSAHLIAAGLQEYYGGPSHTPPIFLSSYKPLAGETRLDTLGIGRGRGTRVSWFPRPEEKQPSKLSADFIQALREEAVFWARNRELLGVGYGRSKWPSYNPPFDHIIAYCDQMHLELNEDKLKSVAHVVFRDQELSPEKDSDALLARHCKAYIEIRKEVTQADVQRLRKLAERFPLPIVLLYWNTAPHVSNLSDCGVLASLIEATEDNLYDRMEEAAIEWAQRMEALDTVVGGQRFGEIRDDLLRWRLGSQTAGAPARKPKPLAHAMLVAGPTGSGKTAVSRWCHFYSSHFTQDDQTVRSLWQDIRVPNPDRQGASARLGDACSGHKTDFLRAWAANLIQHGGFDAQRDTPPNLFQTAFKKGNLRPWLVNLVGVTRNDEFISQLAGAYPSWTGSQWPGDWRPGAILNATNNSLILNEIGELESEAQGLLLELIERGGPLRPMFAPVGGEVEARKVLFILATDRVDKIRKQLLHRCRIVRVPSLLECQDDIPELARHRLLPRWCCLSSHAEQILKGWPYWPGNHRSLHATLDFAAERLPFNRRVIQVPDLIRALWREDLVRIPSRLDSLIRWFLEWPELEGEASEVPVLSQAITRMANLPDSDWAEILANINRIAGLVFENPSAHFTNLLGTKKSKEQTDRNELISKAIGLFAHEIFRTVAKLTERLKEIEGVKQSRTGKLNEIAGIDLERRLVDELLDDAIVTLSLGTILWRVLCIKPVEIAKANDLLRARVPKASGRRARAAGERAEIIETTDTGDEDDNPNDEGNDIDSYNDDRISKTRSAAGQFSLAIVKAFNSPLRKSLFDYAEDRRDRTYFSPKRHSY